MVRFWLVLSLILVGSGGFGSGSGAALYAMQSTADDEVVPMGRGVVPPRVTKQVQPEHPAKGFKISGAVLISVVVTKEGQPRDVKVVKSLEKEIDQSAMDAVMKWQFAPATKDGFPVAMRVTVEIRFHDM